MLRRNPVSLPSVPAVLSLEVEEAPVNLRVNDLGRAEETGVRRLAVVTSGDLELRIPRSMGDRSQMFGDKQLAGVAQRRRSTLVDLDHHVQADGLTDRAERVDVDAGITLLNSAFRVRRYASSPAHLGASPSMLGASVSDRSACPLGLKDRTLRGGAGSATAWLAHAPIMPMDRLPATYPPIIRRILA